MNETERTKRELEKYEEKPEQFRQQLEEFKKFKKELVKAGVYREDRYTVPLMHRLGDVHRIAVQANNTSNSQ